MCYLSSAETTKQNIIDAFWKLYASGGMSQVTVTKICQLAGYNRSTFYAYFQDVYEVLDTLEASIIPADRFKENVLLPLLNCSDEAQLLKALIHFFERHSPYLPVLLSEYGDPHFKHKLLEKLTPILYKSLPHTSYTKTQLNYIFEYQNAAILSTIARWYQNGKDISQEELISLLLHITSCGIRHTLLSSK